MVDSARSAAAPLRWHDQVAGPRPWLRVAGTGKTHTMEGFLYQQAAGGPSATVHEAAEGCGGQYGVIPTVAAKLFDALRARQSAVGAGEASVSCTYVQIYREQVYDLIGDASALRVDGSSGAAAFGRAGAAPGAGAAHAPGAKLEGLRLRWLPGRGFYLEDVTTQACSSAAEALAVFRTGVKNKARLRRGLAGCSSHCWLG